jgi:FAD synthase
MRNKQNIFYEKITWKVIKGKQVWTSIGFPTANIEFDSNIKLEEGTYRINWIIDSKVFKWAWVFLWKNNVFEAHFMNYKWNLYGKKITIIIFYKIRDNIKFNNLDELKKEISQDLEYVKKNPDYILTFWTFDTFHLWHQFYLERSKLYWDKLVTIVAKWENVQKFKWHKPKLSEKNRLETVRKTWISDIVHLWDTINPLKWLELYDPRAICIWYDQKWFVEDLENHIKENNLKIKIIKIPAFEEKRFKSSLLKNN